MSPLINSIKKRKRRETKMSVLYTYVYKCVCIYITHSLVNIPTNVKYLHMSYVTLISCATPHEDEPALGAHHAQQEQPAWSQCKRRGRSGGQQQGQQHRPSVSSDPCSSRWQRYIPIAPTVHFTPSRSPPP